MQIWLEWWQTKRKWQTVSNILHHIRCFYTTQQIIMYETAVPNVEAHQHNFLSTAGTQDLIAKNQWKASMKLVHRFTMTSMSDSWAQDHCRWPNGYRNTSTWLHKGCWVHKCLAKLAVEGQLLDQIRPLLPSDGNTGKSKD